MRSKRRSSWRVARTCAQAGAVACWSPVRVELEGLGKSYDGRHWAVRGLELAIPSGSVLGLIGPNGAGKSTTLRMMATVMQPSAGTLRLDGEEIGPDPLEARRRIGFLGDGNPLYKQLTPAEYLRFFGQCFRMGRAELEAAIDDTLVTFDLTGKRDTPCAALSKGMRQRLLIARCFLHAPQLLILDEPADGLDPRGRGDLHKILSAARDRGVTIVISSHILRELDDLCDQVAILQGGRLVVAGELEQIIDSHEVGRFVYELRLLTGLELALERLTAHPVLVEHSEAAADHQLIRLQLRGDESRMAELLADLIGAGVKLVTCSRVHSRLEDVYGRVCDQRVN